MSFRTTLRLLIAVGVLGAFIWLVESGSDTTEERAARATRVMPLDVDFVKHIVIERDGLHAECVRRGDEWMLNRPLAVRADSGAVYRVLNTLEELPRVETITADQRAKRELALADYGLDAPRARVAVRDRLGRRELLIGNDAPLGDLVYVKLEGKDIVMAAPRRILDVLPNKVEVLRDRVLLSGDPYHTSRLEIQRPGEGFVQIVRSLEGWNLQQPIAAPAANEKIIAMLSALYEMRIETFVWDPRPKSSLEDAAELAAGDADPAARVVPYGFEPGDARARVAVWVNGDDVSREVIFGKETGEGSGLCYAKLRDGGSVYTVKSGSLDLFSASANDLLNRVIFALDPREIASVRLEQESGKLVLRRNEQGLWEIREPIACLADRQVVADALQELLRWRIASFVSEIPTNASVLGFSPPLLRVQVSTRTSDADNTPAPGEPAKPARSLLVGAARKGSGTRFAKFDNAAFVFEISSHYIENLGPNSVDPLLYRDRTMLAIDADSVNVLTLRRGGGEQTVMRDASGNWGPPPEKAGRVDPEALARTLMICSEMRANSIVGADTRRLDAFGLDAPNTVLTLGLTGDEGIRKSVFLGAAVAEEGKDVYAMVQGQDLVFTLAGELAELLRQDLYAPAPVSPPPAR